MSFTITMPHNEFYNHLVLVSCAMSSEETRYCPNGVCFDDNTMVATTGHILASQVLPCEIVAPEKPILPSSMVKEILRIKSKRGFENSNVTLTFEDGLFTYKSEERDFSLMGKAVDGNFPDWQCVVPENTSLNGVLPVGFDPRFIATLSKAMALASIKNQVIRFETQSRWSEETQTGSKRAEEAPIIVDIDREGFTFVLMPKRL